jgi:hypothetical protein
MAVQQTDLLRVNRGGVDYQMAISAKTKLQPTDLLAVNRGGVDYQVAWSAKAKIQDGDLIAVNRGGVDYQTPWVNVKAAVASSTGEVSPNATLPPGKFYNSSNQRASGASLPFMTAIPDNSDGTGYIDLFSCVGMVPALLLDTNNAVWVVDVGFGAPVKATPPCTGKVIKIAGGGEPGDAGNALALTDTGELWRGWSLSSSPQWSKVTLSFPTSEIISLFSQGSADSFGILVERKSSSGTQWYTVPSAAQALGTESTVGPAGALQVVWSGNKPYWIKADGTIGSTAAVTTTKKYKKLMAAGQGDPEIVGLVVDGTLEYIAGATGAIPLPAGETSAKDLIMTTAIGNPAFLLGGSGNVYISSNGNIHSNKLNTVTWLEMTDLRGKYSTFGTLSSQASACGGMFNLIVPN